MNMFHDRTVTIEEESVTDLIRDLRDETVIMVRQQVELAKTETSEKISQVTKNAATLAVWGAVLYAGFLFLLAGLTFLGYVGLTAAGVSTGIAMWLMPLITAAIVLIIGGIGANSAIKKLKVSPMPNKTVHTLKEDQQWLKNKLKSEKR